MVGRPRVLPALAALLLWASTFGLANAAESPSLQAEASQLLQGAQRTQLATRASLRFPGVPARCTDARFVSYRRSDREPEIVDQWYVVSQLWADATLLS